jgi:hypothetical protein
MCLDATNIVENGEKSSKQIASCEEQISAGTPKAKNQPVGWFL